MSFPYRFRYKISGNRDNPPLLFLHGFLGGKEDWNESLTALEDTYLCVSVDLPGHGSTLVNGIDKYYSMPHVAWGVTNFLNQLQIKKCHLAGYSMGGRLALYLAVKYPEHCNKIIIESSSPGLKTKAECRVRRQRDRALAQKLETENFEKFLKEWYAQPLFTTLKKDPVKFRKLFKRRLKNDPLLLARSLKLMGVGVQPSLWDDISAISSPLLFIAGDLDSKFKELALEMGNLCPQAKVCIIKNCGHNVHFEKPQEYFDTVRQFLKK